MKPHIIHGGHMWYCYDARAVGLGLTPHQAWVDYCHRLVFRAEMGL